MWNTGRGLHIYPFNVIQVNSNDLNMHIWKWNCNGHMEKGKGINREYPKEGLCRNVTLSSIKQILKHEDVQILCPLSQTLSNGMFNNKGGKNITSKSFLAQAVFEHP